MYFANWSYLEVAFRYPKGTVDVKALRRYAASRTVDLRDVGDRNGPSAEFTRRLGALREAHAKKPSFLARLKKACL